MYVHLGKGCLIESFKIIGIFPKKHGDDFYKKLKNSRGSFYEVENLSENGMADSIILTEDKIYLSGISSLTLQKRVNKNLIYYIDGGNNG